MDAPGGRLHRPGGCHAGDVVRLLQRPLAAFLAGVLAGILLGVVLGDGPPVGGWWLGW